MRVELSAAIMAHPSRMRFISELQNRLGREATLVLDQINDRWDTGRRALLAYDPGATHHLVIQDDVLPCRDLIAGCARMLAHVPPERPVALYMGRSRTQPRQFSMSTIVREARRRRACFAAFNGPWWGQAVILPTSLIADAVLFGDEHVEIPNYDHRLANFFAARQIACYYTMPSLVEHRTGQDNPSLLGHGHGAGRRAAWFIGCHRSALDIRWSGQAVTTASLPAHTRRYFPPVPTYPMTTSPRRR